VTTAAKYDATTPVAQVDAAQWVSLSWTPTTAITSYTSVTTNYKTLTGVASLGTAYAYPTTATYTDMTVVNTDLTCDLTKWTSAAACDGILKWGLGTLTEWTSSTAKGSRRAWMWLADVGATNAVFGVEKDNIVNVQIQQSIQPRCNGSNMADVTLASHPVNWGVATYTHAVASTTLLGASAVLAALVSFF